MTARIEVHQDELEYTAGRVAVWTSWILATLATSCVSKAEQIEARANGILVGIVGSRAHFAAEAETICSEMPEAKTQVVPPLDKNCSRGCRCASESTKNDDFRTTYDCDEWKKPEWTLLRFAGMYSMFGEVSKKVYVHHQASWHKTDQGCRLDFVVRGDLDEDGVYSTYASWSETTPKGTLGELPAVSLLWE